MSQDSQPSPQRREFLESEGDRFHDRNPISAEELTERGERDPIVQAVTALALEPQRILEIGSSHGWRLAWFHREFPDARCCGIEPSAQAVAAAFPGIELVQGTADALPYDANSFDLVIYGFCLYLCDREDLFRIAQEGDRVLAEGGHLVILDFSVKKPRRNAYAHVPGMYSYKQDYPQMFLWNPAYRVLHHETAPHTPGETPSNDNRIGVTVMQRRLAGAYDDPTPAGQA